jgi:TRAP-type C4-dicarboxylate transport system substrate-binding protein
MRGLTLRAFSAILFLGALASSAASQTKLTFTTPYPDRLFHVVNIKEFIKEVQEKSKGSIEITLHTAESLFKHADTMQAVRSGQVDMAELQLTQFANQEELYNFESLPFLATNYDDTMKIWDAAKPFVEKRLARDRIRILYTVPWPPQAFYAKKELKTLDDMKGLKFRVYNKLGARMAELFGAQPVLVGGGEVPQAFATGMINSMITSSAFGASAKAWDFVDHFHDVQAWLGMNQILINERSFQRLKPDEQKIIADAAKAAAERGLRLSKEANEAEKATLAKNGMKVLAATPEFMEAARKASAPLVEEWAKTVGDDARQILAKYQELTKK